MGKSGMRGAEDQTDKEQADERLEELREEAKNMVLVEYVGEPPYYREFMTSHTIHKSSADPKHKTEKLSFAGQGIEVPQDLVWSADKDWMVQVPADQTALLEGLRKQPFLKVRD
jgi:hypothetical protein